MEIDNLVHMANRIGQFFESYTDRTEALEGVASHIRKFWAPPMRVALLGHLARHPQDSGLLPLVADAVRAHLVPAE